MSTTETIILIALMIVMVILSILEQKDINKNKKI
jgi:hypothetical protein